MGRMMQITYLQNSDIDKEKWDACIRNAPNGNVYAYSWYLDTVSAGWDALVGDDYDAVFPLTKRKKWGVQYLCQPPFSQQLGLFAKSFISSELQDLFITRIPAHFRLIEINLNKYHKQLQGNNTLMTSDTYELDLIYPYEELRKLYVENTSRNIKKSAAKGIYVSPHLRPEFMIELFKNNRGKHINTLSEKDYKMLLQLIYKSLNNKTGEILGVFDEHNELCAAAFFVQANGKVVFLFSALSPVGRECSAMFFLIDHFIRSHAGKPLVLDFEGSNNPELARFYAGFGAKKNRYFQLHQNNLPYFVKQIHSLYKIIKSRNF
ncbi:MAG: hypothetical protein BWY70_00310 [Bacteroidetes bacterium ADurb.Bin408]|nr:MAG: hypothetical protein BWY70_00310 [Bacteroidetes bacterium ADurb.Bin408]